MNRLSLMTALSLFVAGSALAQVEVKDPWVRATVPAQTATGAFMELTAKEDARLVAARSPVAKIVEIHEMKMEGGVMKMRAIPKLDLPAGKPVTLSPSGYHIMLMGLKGQVKEGDSVPLTLVVETKTGKQEIQVKAHAMPLGGDGQGHSHH
ncbi:copper chaperone PCu(A)C [Thiobacter aerophilum]|uniref:Copper chaperone PCu(A)C n=1 Tax=Thiobacter aerophilum TaxID=3121275 RepID=A0ABV0EBW7_9BURK